MAATIEKPSNPQSDDTGAASSRGKEQTSGVPVAARSRKRAERRGANIHIQDEDQAPTGKNAGDERAASEAAESEGHTRGKARTVAGRSG